MSAMGKIEADRALSPAEAMGIKIGKKTVVHDLNVHAWQVPGPRGGTWLHYFYERKNRITLSAGDAELDHQLWTALGRDSINAQHAETFARAA